MIEPMNTIAHLWWGWMIAMTWQVGLLILVIGCIDLLIRKWAWPQLRYALWSLILLKLVLPPTLALPSGVIGGLRPALEKAVACLRWQKPSASISDFRFWIADSSHGDDLGSESVGQRLDGPPIAGAAHQMADMPTSANPQSAIVNPQLDWRVYAMGVWLLGATVLGVFLASRLRSLSKGRSETCEESPVPESFYNRMSHCASRVGLRRLPRVVSTTRLANPAVFGAFRPILLMPVGYLSRLSRRDTEHVLLHEFCHIKRGDLFVHGLTLVLQVLYWFNPLLWLVRRHIHHLRELCCDASVANLLREDTPAYRETLLETARRFLATHGEPGLGLLGLFEDSNCLLVRLNWLQKPTWRYRKMKSLIVIVIAGFMAACVLPMAQAQPQAGVQDATTVPHVSDTPISQDVQSLQEQMQRLQEQMQQLATRMAELNTARAQVQHEAAGTGLFERYTVKEGDTLAKIAEKIAGSDQGRIEDTIARIKEANQLTADRVAVGRKLWIPARSGMPENVVDGTPAILAMPTVPHSPQVDLPVLPHSPLPPAHTDDNRAAVELEGQYSVTPLKPNMLVRVQNEVGSVKVHAGEDENCTVKATVKGKAETEQQATEVAKKVQIRVTPEDGLLRIGALIPDEARKGDGKGVEIAFEITVPRQTRVEVSQRVGGVKLSDLKGSVSTKVDVGSIAGRNLTGDVEMFTRAGSIDISVPAEASAKVKATTRVGNIKSDLPLDVTNTAILHQGQVRSALGSTASGTLGTGQGKLNLQVEVGSIKITSATSTPKEDRPSEF
jgi:beta-lactamase regulating signal transducer with metallopeptidase domain